MRNSYLFKNPLHHWLKKPTHLSIISALIVLTILALVVILFRADEENISRLESERPPIDVTTTKLANLRDNTTIELSGVIESAQAAPLVARTGGRVTSVKAELGETAGAGQVLVVIDGQNAANPIRAQVTGARRSLNFFAEVQATALFASNTAIDLAKQSLDQVIAQKPLAQEQTAIARRLADNSVEETRLNLQDARDSGVDALIRSADLADKAAQLAQDQATLALRQATQNTDQAIESARLNLTSARAAKTRLVADLANQRSQLTTQLNVASENLRLQQILAPVNGSITRLTVTEGDFVSPGEVIGEIDALSGAKVVLDVSTGIRNRLALGEEVTMKTTAQTFTGTVAHSAAAPNSTTGKWQVEFYITETPETIHPRETVSVLLPVGGTYKNSYFLPLDAVTVRQDGLILFVVTGDEVSEHPLEVINFEGDFIEAKVDLPLDATIVTQGNRLLRTGDKVVSH